MPVKVVFRCRRLVKRFVFLLETNDFGHQCVASLQRFPDALLGRVHRQFYLRFDRSGGPRCWLRLHTARERMENRLVDV